MNGADSEGLQLLCFRLRPRRARFRCFCWLVSVPVVPKAPSLEVDPEYQDRRIDIDVETPLSVPLVSDSAANFTAMATGENIKAEVQTGDE